MTTIFPSTIWHFIKPTEKFEPYDKLKTLPRKEDYSAIMEMNHSKIPSPRSEWRPDAIANAVNEKDINMHMIRSSEGKLSAIEMGARAFSSPDWIFQRYSWYLDEFNGCQRHSQAPIPIAMSLPSSDDTKKLLEFPPNPVGSHTGCGGGVPCLSAECFARVFKLWEDFRVSNERTRGIGENLCSLQTFPLNVKIEMTRQNK